MSQDGNRDTVLVIDDDPDFRTLVEACGNCCQVRVLEAPDCSGGLKILEREGDRIKVVLLDYFMPGMAPEQCAAAIVAKAGTSISVVLLTAAADPAARASELKVTRWISKPFDVSTLTNLLVRG